MDEQLLAELQETLRVEMPICEAMQIEPVAWDGAQLAMQMPLRPNRNHQDTAFAGSLSALCTIVGWGTLFLQLLSRDLPGNILIRRGAIRYLRPVKSPEIVARSLPLASDDLDYFLELLASKGRSKIDVSAEIADADGALVTFHGSYVVKD